MTRFQLARASAVRILVLQQAPRCRRLGRYVVRAPRGATELRLRRRVGSHRLGDGTYRVVATTRGVKVLDVRIRLVVGKGVVRVRHDHLADVCVAASAASSSVGDLGPTGEAGASSNRPTAQGAVTLSSHRPARASSSGRAPFLPPVLRDLNPANASPLVRVILFTLLGCAIVLFAAGAAPEQVAAAVPIAGVAARRRTAIVVVGFALLLAALVITLAA